MAKLRIKIYPSINPCSVLGDVVEIPESMKALPIWKRLWTTDIMALNKGTQTEATQTTLTIGRPGPFTYTFKTEAEATCWKDWQHRNVQRYNAQRAATHEQSDGVEIWE